MNNVNEVVQLTVDKEGIEAFVLCLGLGTLLAIKEGTLPPRFANGTVGRPNTYKPLQNQNLISDKTANILSGLDELSAIQQLLPHEFLPIIDELIDELKTELTPYGDSPWYLNWLLNYDIEQIELAKIASLNDQVRFIHELQEENIALHGLLVILKNVISQNEVDLVSNDLDKRIEEIVQKLNYSLQMMSAWRKILIGKLETDSRANPKE
ncbi:MAG TPA: hypothetical protein VLL52_23420 [Anaerolineae bacterium]|nr:hypothetical protein [Anaerolineae bacterium]